MAIPTEVLVASITGAVALLAGLLTHKGRTEETSATKLSTLIEGQGKRIDSLQERLASVEARLADTEARLRQEQDYTYTLRRALRDAIEFTVDVLEWMRAPGGRPEPHAPDVEEWRAVLDSIPEK